MVASWAAKVALVRCPVSAFDTARPSVREMDSSVPAVGQSEEQSLLVISPCGVRALYLCLQVTLAQVLMEEVEIMRVVWVLREGGSFLFWPASPLHLHTVTPSYVPYVLFSRFSNSSHPLGPQMASPLT